MTAVISRQHYSCEIVGSGVQLPVLSGSITMDENSVPFVSGDVVVPLTDVSILSTLDPTRARVRITATQRFGDSEPISNLSDTLTGLTLADIDFATVKEVTNTYGRPYNAFGMRSSTRRHFDLGVRRRSVDYTSGTVSLSLASDERLADDYALVQTLAINPPSSQARAVVNFALARIGAVLQEDNLADANIRSDGVTWNPGETLWDYVKPIVDSAELRLWCDSERRWHLTNPKGEVRGTRNYTDQTVAVLSEDWDRESWFDAVIIEYRWRDSSDVEHVVYDVAKDSENYQRAITYRVDRVWPGDGAAEALLRRARTRGKKATMELVSDWLVEPGFVISINYGGIVTIGAVSSVSWNLTDDTMQITTRELEDAVSTSWFLAPDIAWEEVPAGIDWTEAEDLWFSE